MHALPVLDLHSLQTPQLFGALLFTYPGTCLSGLHEKLGNLHMGPGKQILPVLLSLYSSCLRVVLGQKETLSPSGVRTLRTA